jgi:hypothetical protein
VDSTISMLIAAAESGDRTAGERLFAALYPEPHRLARRQPARQRSGVTPGVATLLHEASLDVSRRDGADFPDRGRFTPCAAKVLRGRIVDHARRSRPRTRGLSERTVNRHREKARICLHRTIRKAALP